MTDQNQVIVDKKLEDIISELMSVYEYSHDDEFLAGYVLIVNTVRFNDDRRTPDSSFSYFCREGQQPCLTRGIVESFLDRWRTFDNE